MSEFAIRPGRYRHYKGRDYQVYAVAQHSETDEALVVYRPLYGEGRLFVRPLAMFSETVEHGGQSVPRFAFVADSVAAGEFETPNRHQQQGQEKQAGR